MLKKVSVFVICAGVVVLIGVGIIASSRTSATDATQTDSSQSETNLISGKGKSAQDRPLISYSPKSLAIQSGDLPNAFTLDNGESPTKNEYNHVFFNPYALLDGEQRDDGLMGIIIQIKLMDSLLAAKQEFVDQGGFDLEAVKRDIRIAIPEAKPISIEPYTISMDHADKVAAYKVHYLLQNVHVYDYRCRMTVRNVVANVLVSARGSADVEPEVLQKQAVGIFQKQRDRLWQ